MRIADLPWYDLPELRAATDAWWQGIAVHLRRLGERDVPAQLHRDVAHDENWRSPHLLLSQACGYDVLYDLREVLQPVATPHYALPGCTGPRYRSVVVVRAAQACRTIADLRGARCAINEATSHSGTNALRPLVAPLSRDGAFFASVAATGSHTDSLAMLRSGAADVACIDAVVLELVRRVRPGGLDGVRELTVTAAALAPPYVTSVHTDAATLARLQAALHAAATDPDLAACRNDLHLTRFEFAPTAAYAELASFEHAALQCGYFELPAPHRSPLSTAAPRPTDRAASRSCAEGAVDRRGAGET